MSDTLREKVEELAKHLNDDRDAVRFVARIDTANLFLANAVLFAAAEENAAIVARLQGLLSALHFAEARYRSMWFGGGKPVSNCRGEWEAIKGAINSAEAALAAAEKGGVKS